MANAKSEGPETGGSVPEDASDAAPARDMVFVYERVDPGDGYRVLRARASGEVELGQLQQVREGQPIHGELVRLEQRPEHEQLFDMEVLLDRAALGGARTPNANGANTSANSDAKGHEREARGASAARARSGPPQVSTPAYRDNYARIFARPALPAASPGARALAGGAKQRGKKGDLN